MTTPAIPKLEPIPIDVARLDREVWPAEVAADIKRIWNTPDPLEEIAR